MKTIVRFLIASLVVFIISDQGGGFAAAAAHPHANAGGMTITFASAFTGFFNPGGYVIEQQSTDPNNPVVNPSTASPKTLWDVDDLRQYIASGSLGAGESYSIDVPAILDNGLHYLVIQGNAGSKGGTLSLSIPELGYTYSRTIGRDGDRWCMVGPGFDLSDPRLQSIAGSNGGIGLPATYRWTITATGATHSPGLTAQVFYGNLQQQQDLCGGTNRYPAGLLAIIGP